ncbi:hypothetical protein pb186bvf_011269 [Paramecium bursaria]
MNIQAQFAEQVAEPLSFAEFDLLFEKIDLSFKTNNYEEIQKIMSENYYEKMKIILESIYYFQTYYSQFNSKKYSQVQFNQLMVFAEIYIKQIHQNSTIQQCYPLLVLGMKVALKAQHIQLKLAQNFLEQLYLSFTEDSNLLDNLLVFLRTELFNAPKEHITDYLFLLQYLIRHILDVRTLQPQIIQFLAELFIVFSNPANLNQGPRFNYCFADIIDKTFTKLQKFDAAIFNQFMLQQGIMDFLLLVIEPTAELQTQLYMISTFITIAKHIINNTENSYQSEQSNQAIYFQRIAEHIIVALTEKSLQQELHFAYLEYICVTLDLSQLYQFYRQASQTILLKILFFELAFKEQDIQNLTQNPQEFYQCVQSYISAEIVTVQGLCSNMLIKLSQRIDGFSKFVTDLCIEIQLFIMEQIEETPLQSQIAQSFPDLKFAMLEKYAQSATITLIMIIMKDSIVQRKDLRQSVEKFIKIYYKISKNKSFLLNRCLGIEFLKVYLPHVFLKQEQIYKKQIYRVFKMMCKPKLKEASYIFYVELLISILKDQEGHRFEKVITDFVVPICSLITTIPCAEYFEFISQLINTSNMIVDQNLGRIMQALRNRIHQICIKKFNDKVFTEGEIVVRILQIIDQIINMDYCMKYSAVVEPQIIDIFRIMTEYNSDYIEELYETCSKYIAWAQGLTELTYSVYEDFEKRLNQGFDYQSIRGYFSLFFFTAVYASKLLLEQPKWILSIKQFIIHVLSKNPQKEEIFYITLLFQTLCQFIPPKVYFVECYLDIIKELFKLIIYQIKDQIISTKLVIAIFSPAIVDPLILKQSPEYCQVLCQIIPVCEVAFNKPQTILNYKYIFFICRLIITLFNDFQGDNNRAQIVQHFFSIYLNKYQAYIQKIQFETQSKKGELDLEIKLRKEDLFNIDIDSEKQFIILTDFSFEKKKEKPYLNDFEILPLFQGDIENKCFMELLQFIKQSYPQVWLGLNQADEILLKQISQLRNVVLDDREEVRSVFILSKSKRKVKQQKQFNVL